VKRREMAERLYKDKFSHKNSYLNLREIKKFADGFLNILFPQRFDGEIDSIKDLEQVLTHLEGELSSILRRVEMGGDDLEQGPAELAAKIVDKFDSLEKKLVRDAEAMLSGDPAAESLDEVIMCYPGFTAVAIYRLAHELFILNIPIFPRVLTEYAHQLTGIDIHPGAEIGDGFCIDHGTGVVIGETTQIGNHVKVYQGVTLGALSVEKGLQHQKRHPTIEDNCVIYSNATILGGKTVIGESSIVGGNVWLTKSVPPHSMVYHQSEVKMQKGSVEDPPS
jgi:serine O-acetyltransferase